jgi:uncharacterized protein
MRGIRIALVLLGSLIVATAQAATEKRVALVIGNERYGTLGNLKNAGNDAAAMADRLKALGFAAGSVRNADRAQMLKSLRNFRESAAGADLAVVFYAGHGIQSAGENYLVPTDIDIQDEVDLPDAAISLRGLVSQLQAGGVKRSLIILDACRDNPMVKRFADSAKGAGRSSGVGRGLAVVEKTPAETVVWFSTEAGQIAADGDGKNSPFTAALLAAMEQPGLSTDDVFRQVVRSVKGQSPRPYGMFSDAVVLVPAARKADPAAVLAPVPVTDSGDREVIFWQSVKDSKDSADFQAYLAKYPGGDFAVLAKNRLEALKPTKVAVIPTKVAEIPTPVPKPPAAAADTAAQLHQKGEAAYNHKNYAEAMDWFRKAAELGNADAMSYIGYLYLNALGIPADYAEAMRWYLKSADLGDATAMYQIGYVYENAQGVPTNYAEAMRWYRKSADLGYASAMYLVGYFYHNALGVPADYAEAMRWYRKAAALGNGGATSQVGYLYHNALGVPADYAEAMRWYRKAADLGTATAMYQIGYLYYNALGVPADYAEAMRWYRKSADLGEAMAMNQIGVLFYQGKGVTADRAEAKRWFEKAAAKGNLLAPGWLALY